MVKVLDIAGSEGKGRRSGETGRLEDLLFAWRQWDLRQRRPVRRAVGQLGGTGPNRVGLLAGQSAQCLRLLGSVGLAVGRTMFSLIPQNAVSILVPIDTQLNQILNQMKRTIMCLVIVFSDI